MVEDRGERLQIMLSAEELHLLDNFRFNKRMPSRASAVRELLKRGLAAEGFERTVEVGPGRVLTGMTPRIAAGAEAMDTAQALAE